MAWRPDVGAARGLAIGPPTAALGRRGAATFFGLIADSRWRDAPRQASQEVGAERMPAGAITRALGDRQESWLYLIELGFPQQPLLAWDVVDNAFFGC